MPGTPGTPGRRPGPLEPGWPGRDGHQEPPGSTAGDSGTPEGPAFTEPTPTPSRESNTERNNKALSVMKLISSWIGKVWQCLGGCGRPLWPELEHPQKSTSPLGSSGAHRSALADSHCSSLGSADGATPPSLLFHHQLLQAFLEKETKMLLEQRIPAQDT